ncbi:MAG: hypothetical protein M3H12_18775 [Chromatiales bacterium]|nr:hypothetical protein [Gammaproteobacteria bacterium]
MAALTEDRATEMMDGKLLAIGVAAAAMIYGGSLVVADANGYAAPGSISANLAAMGRAEEFVDNTGGADGEKTVRVRRGRAFKFENSGTNPLTQAHVGRSCYVEDDQTVSSNATGTSVAGEVLGVESDGVWVFIG